MANDKDKQYKTESKIAHVATKGAGALLIGAAIIIGLVKKGKR